ncbi:hypothetical protein MUK42_33197 [Musa troglodytarum]|uniref:Uncharacterized protein n=1 Tax=Musa troglodytarum TaxID=320322 RepID=A0A9E7K757_9LILI|nr:hypothetical protein MUK42_33197 [Musa troglodytarum]
MRKNSFDGGDEKITAIRELMLVVMPTLSPIAHGGHIAIDQAIFLKLLLDLFSMYLHVHLFGYLWWLAELTNGFGTTHGLFHKT